jgi:hypothetical protein
MIVQKIKAPLKLNYGGLKQVRGLPAHPSAAGWEAGPCQFLGSSKVIMHPKFTE